MRRGDSHIQEKCTGSTATLSARRRRERHAMRHAADGKRLDQRLTVCLVPYAAHEAPETPPNALGRGSRLATTHDFASGAEFPQALEAQARAFATTNHGFAVCRWRLLGVRSLVT